MKYFISFLIFSLMATMSYAEEEEGGIAYYENYVPPKPGGEAQIRLISFVGTQSEYEIIADEWKQNELSYAVCGAVKQDHDKYSLKGPCATTLKEHKQLFFVKCANDDDSYAAITFFPNKGKNVKASIITYGNIYAGFDTDKNNLARSPNEDKPLVSNAVNSGAVLNCRDSHR